MSRHASRNGCPPSLPPLTRRAGRGARDRRLLERVVVPVLLGAVERSFAIATGMEARGFGATHAVTRGAAPLTVGAVGAAGAALLAVLDPAWPRWSAPALALLAGVLTLVLVFALPGLDVKNLLPVTAASRAAR